MAAVRLADMMCVFLAGSICETKALWNGCDLGPCENGGTCEDVDDDKGNFTCHCAVGFAGDRCEKDLIVKFYADKLADYLSVDSSTQVRLECLAKGPYSKPNVSVFKFNNSEGGDCCHGDPIEPEDTSVDGNCSIRTVYKVLSPSECQNEDRYCCCSQHKIGNTTVNVTVKAACTDTPLTPGQVGGISIGVLFLAGLCVFLYHCLCECAYRRRRLHKLQHSLRNAPHDVVDMGHPAQDVREQPGKQGVVVSERQDEDGGEKYGGPSGGQVLRSPSSGVGASDAGSGEGGDDLTCSAAPSRVSVHDSVTVKCGGRKVLLRAAYNQSSHRDLSTRQDGVTVKCGGWKVLLRAAYNQSSHRDLSTRQDGVTVKCGGRKVLLRTAYDQSSYRDLSTRQDGVTVKCGGRKVLLV
ncbi:hypothetical protein BaRGS_00034366 [Batillaria attramentaria]|uniref:EGF-like domain-containing protein n=1 Tax=Batillaria attramentaria TaxID=370345 RepID=A0ABD0JHE4_9CAEN